MKYVGAIGGPAVYRTKGLKDGSQLQFTPEMGIDSCSSTVIFEFCIGVGKLKKGAHLVFECGPSTFVS